LAAPEVRQFEAIDQSLEYPNDTILFIGSSIFRLWNLIEEDIIFYTDQILANHMPEIIVCFIANDIKGAPEDESPKKISDLIKYL